MRNAFTVLLDVNVCASKSPGADSVGLGCYQVCHFQQVSTWSPCCWPGTNSVRSKPSGLRGLAKTYLGRRSLCTAAQSHTRTSTSTLTVFGTRTEQAPQWSLPSSMGAWASWEWDSSCSISARGDSPGFFLPPSGLKKEPVNSKKGLWVGLILCFSGPPCIHNRSQNGVPGSENYPLPSSPFATTVCLGSLRTNHIMLFPIFFAKVY